MPNWCDTQYTCIGNKEQVKRLYDAAMKSFNPPDMWESLSSEGWLGYIVMELGGDYKKVYCRGWQYQEPQLSADGETVTIYSNTAWCEMEEFRKFIRKKLKLEVYFVAIDPGCDYYCTNDPEYEGKYYVDAAPEQPDNPFMTEDEVCEFVEKYYQTNVNSIDDCIAFSIGLNDDDGDESFLYIHPMEYSE